MKQHIYRYTPAGSKLEIVRDNPIDPGNIFFDKAGHLMVVSYIGNGTVYALDPDKPSSDMRQLKAVPAAEVPAGAIPVLPVDRRRVESAGQTAIADRKPWAFVSPDNSVYLPASDDFVGGALYYGTKMADVLRAFALARPSGSKPFYITDEDKKKTYSATVNPDGSLKDMKLFTNQRGEGVTADKSGNVYIAAGQVYVYSPAGKPLGEIAVPERPTSLSARTGARSTSSPAHRCTPHPRGMRVCRTEQASSEAKTKRNSNARLPTAS